jgi:hypothetical protein
MLTGLLGLDVPSHDHVRVDSAKVSDLIPTEYSADAVVVLTTAERPVMAVIVEMQRRRDRAKRRSWPVYLTTLRARLDCPVALLVVSPTAAVARWCAAPIPLGHPGLVLTPLVVGPDLVPVVTDPARARSDPELTVLSALTHAHQPEHYPVLHALLAALDVVDHDMVELYHDLVFAALPPAARRHLEEQMTATYEYRSEFMRNLVSRSEARGEVRGEAHALLAVLEARGVDVPDGARTHILGCTDAALLDTWVRRAATATAVGELFVDGAVDRD